MKQYIYSALALTAVMGFTSCQNEEEMPSVGNASRQVTLTITADKGNYDTRTTMDVVDGNLVTYWETTDKLIVTNEVENGETAQNFGVLDYVSGAGTTKATFSNTIVIPADIKYVHVTYLGKKYTADLTDYTGNIEYSVANQTGSIADLTQNDVLTSYQPIAIPDGTANFKVEDVTLTRNFSYGYFELKDLPFTLAKGDVIKVSSPEGKLLISQKISANKTSSIKGAATDNTITITKGETGNTFYLAMVPQTCSLQFEVTKDGIRYTAKLGENTWNATEYYRADANNTPIAVSVWTEEVLPTDPGDMSNWGADVNSSYNTCSLDFTKYGRYTNCLDLRGYGGWARWIEYHNGITSNFLTSNVADDIFFQFGRIMGFPSNVKNTPYCPNYSKTPLTFGTAGNPGGYYSRYEVEYTNWSTAYSNDYPYVYSKSQYSSSSLDWNGNNPKGTFESFCGNPCPDGYRLPTAEEMAIFVPSTGEVNGSLVELKTINGESYAVEWVVQKAISGKSNAQIKVRTAKSNVLVKVGDPIFNNSKTISFIALGYLNDGAGYSGQNECGIYWTNDAGNAGDLLSNVSGNGGQALYFELSNNQSTATIMLAGIPKTFAGNIIPIKDNKSKGGGIFKPYFPYGAAWPN